MVIEPGPLINLWFQVQHYPFWANWAFAWDFRILISSCSIASNLHKNQVVHEQKFTDPLSSTYQISPERKVLDLESEVSQRPGFYSD